jgi:hypothetical protein
MQWYRSFNIHKEVTKTSVLLRIPFHTLQASDLTLQSWYFTKEGNEMHLLLDRVKNECPIEKLLEEKRNNYSRYAMYPGERLR